MFSGAIPSARNSSIGSDSPRSHLFKTRKTGLSERKASLAILRSRWSKYFDESRVTKITSADSMASWICSWMDASKSSLGSLSPAVSTRMKELSIVAMTLSRVVPSSRATMAMFLCAMRFKILDFPALVCPIRATIGRFFMVILYYKVYSLERILVLVLVYEN